MLGSFVAAPTILASLTSCGGCDDCEAACMNGCEDTCSGTCSDGCSGGSTGSSSGCSDCSSTCSGSSTGTTCSACANDCSSSCKETCQSTCEDSCSTSCEGSSTGKPTTGTINGHEYVDLGLSVLWATCNIGATSPEDKGSEFPFVYPDWYKENGQESWYRQFRSLNLKPDSSICGTYLDIAKDKWGDKWRLPSKDEIRELDRNCDSILIPKVGLKLTSKINGNSIILPFTIYDDWENKGYGACWSGDTVIYKATNSDNEYVGAYVLQIVQVGDGGYIKDVAGDIVYPSFSGSYYYVNLHVIHPVADRTNGDVSTCNGSCTANCSSNCSSTCMNECSGTCKGSCGSDCTGGCKEGCSSGCQTTCKGSCSTTCSSTCTGGCSSGCSSTCKGTCSGGCGSGCSGGCAGCTSSCQTNCQFGCVAACSNDCSSGCTGGCDGSCRGTCVTGCTGTCYNTCNDTCFGSCRITCEGWSK